MNSGTLTSPAADRSKRMDESRLCQALGLARLSARELPCQNAPAHEVPPHAGELKHRGGAA